MRSCVLTFPVRSGTGTQTITGVADASGPFVGTFFFFRSAYAGLNVVTSPGWPDNNFAINSGADFLTVRSAGSLAAANFGFHDAGSGASFGDNSIIDYTAQLSFGGVINRRGKVTASTSGQFEITFTQNDKTGDYILVTVFGGDDLFYDNIQIGNGLHTLTNKPQGLYICRNNPTPGASGGTFTGTGGTDQVIGWDTRNGDRGSAEVGTWYGATSVVNSNQTPSSFVTTHDTPTEQAIVSNWSDSALTISGNTSGVSSNALVFEGPNIRCAAGVLTQRATTGLQSFVTGIKAKWITFISWGYPASLSVVNTDVQLVEGWADKALNQVCWWGGDGASATNLGARYLSDATVLRFAVSNNTSTVFTATASLTALTSFGTATLNWLTNDGVARQILWFAIGEEAEANPANLGSGIYKMVLDRLNDELYLDFSILDTALFKIPDPKIYTSLIGDE